MSAPAVPSLREQLVDAGVAVTAERGWAGVTMAALAAEVGVSRQTVYNEIGTKPALAEAMILRELERFLAVVHEGFDAHPADLADAIRAATRGVLEFSADNALLRAVVSATHGADTELLPLLTTHAGSLLETAKGVVLGRVAAYDVEPTGRELEAVVDIVVRAVLSHVMAPSDTPARTAADLAGVAGRLTGARRPGSGPARARPPRGRPG